MSANRKDAGEARDRTQFPTDAVRHGAVPERRAAGLAPRVDPETGEVKAHTVRLDRASKHRLGMLANPIVQEWVGATLREPDRDEGGDNESDDPGEARGSSSPSEKPARIDAGRAHEPGGGKQT
jgi:hypothetical protein